MGNRFKSWIKKCLAFTAIALVFIVIGALVSATIRHPLPGWTLLSGVAIVVVLVLVLFIWIHNSSRSLDGRVFSENMNDFPVLIEEHEIQFPEGYWFAESPLHQIRKVAAQTISEVNLNTIPATLVVDDREVIFLRYDQNEQIQEFAVRNGIEVTQRLDIWEYLNQPFLDTEFEKEQKIRTYRILAENGVRPRETRMIRNKIRWVMWMQTMSMEWEYLGQFDYLRVSGGGEKRYWWSMDIALRNYKKKSNGSVRCA